jgi:hypothetical protein
MPIHLDLIGNQHLPGCPVSCPVKLVSLVSLYRPFLVAEAQLLQRPPEGGDADPDAIISSSYLHLWARVAAGRSSRSSSRSLLSRSSTFGVDPGGFGREQGAGLEVHLDVALHGGAADIEGSSNLSFGEAAPDSIDDLSSEIRGVSTHARMLRTGSMSSKNAVGERMEVELSIFEAPSGRTEKAITTRFEAVASLLGAGRLAGLEHS